MYCFLAQAQAQVVFVLQERLGSKLKITSKKEGSLHAG